MKSAETTPIIQQLLSDFLRGLKKLPERMAICLSKLDSKLSIRQRIILFGFVFAIWGTVIVIQTIAQYQSVAMPFEPVPERTGVLMDSTINQTKTLHHENIQP